MYGTGTAGMDLDVDNGINRDLSGQRMLDLLGEQDCKYSKPSLKP